MALQPHYIINVPDVHRLLDEIEDVLATLPKNQAEATIQAAELEYVEVWPDSVLEEKYASIDWPELPAVEHVPLLPDRFPPLPEVHHVDGGDWTPFKPGDPLAGIKPRQFADPDFWAAALVAIPNEPENYKGDEPYAGPVADKEGCIDESDIEHVIDLDVAKQAWDFIEEGWYLRCHGLTRTASNMHFGSWRGYRANVLNNGEYYSVFLKFVSDMPTADAGAITDKYFRYMEALDIVDLLTQWPDSERKEYEVEAAGLDDEVIPD